MAVSPESAGDAAVSAPATTLPRVSNGKRVWLEVPVLGPVAGVL